MVTTDCGQSPLFVASAMGHLEVVRALLSAGALVDLDTTDFSSSPLYVASRGGHVEVVRTLLSAGAQAIIKQRAAVAGRTRGRRAWLCVLVVLAVVAAKILVGRVSREGAQAHGVGPGAGLRLRV